MKTYNITLEFGYKDDVNKYGQKLTDEDLKNKNYNKTYCRFYQVEESNKMMAVARAMEKANQEGWCTGNYLYVIDIQIEEAEPLE